MANTIEKQFGRNLRRRRKDLRLTLDDVAQATGLTPGYVSNLEHGIRDPTLTTLAAVAAALKVAPSTLLQGVHPSKIKDAPRT